MPSESDITVLAFRSLFKCQLIENSNSQQQASGNYLLKSQEHGSDLYAQHSIELLDDKKSHPDEELVLYIYSDSRVGAPQKYSSEIRISGFPGKTVIHGAVIPTLFKR
jgi:hypothetical protein